MPKRILVDAAHSEETRVVVLVNGRVQEFESETSIKAQHKGNIYLAKVTRVEPSLQAAFVDYGQDRHGFLPFSEIHPDYYNIPVNDKKDLLASLRREQNDSDPDDDEGELKSGSSENKNGNTDEESDESDGDEGVDVGGDDTDISTDNLSGLDLYKRYKIQEVIKRNQIILIQVEKEERGNKGASLTTFISLAGKYSVLMPNSIRKGGVSRRIASYDDRKRLKKIVKDLSIPEDMGLIVRTAGGNKKTVDIRCDYDYLAGLWNKIRQGTLNSKAPAFIHAEGDIVTRTLRDIYDDGVDELLIEGDKAYENAKSFMQDMMPHHLSRVKLYKNKVPILSRYRVEEQISLLYAQQAQLESGGSIVISPTEALISIDVNSGKLTNTRNVEETAASTNLEASREIARQLRLRNLSGLIVIDFIDMVDLKNKKAVERELKSAFSGDRAKIQIGRISNFGLLEMSRQRLSPSFLEVNTVECPICKGGGFVKAPESTAVNVLRAIEYQVGRMRSVESVTVRTPIDVAMYLLNYKREKLSDIESRTGIDLMVYPDDTMGVDHYVIETDKSLSKRGDSESHPPKNKRYKDKKKTSESRVEPRAKPQANGESSPPPTKGGASSMFEGLWQRILD